MANKKKLGEILLDAGVITPQQLREALDDQKRYGGKLGTILLERRFIVEKDFFSALTRQLQIPAVDFTRSTIPEAVIKTVPLEIAEKYAVFPIALKPVAGGKVLVLAMADPTNVDVADEVRFSSGYRVEPALALESTIRYAIREYYYQQDGKGSYRMQAESDFGAPRQNNNEMKIEHSRLGAPEEPRLISAPDQSDLSLEAPPEETNQGEAKPQLSRELKALLRLLAKKGLITSKEYLEAFKEVK